MRIFPLARGPDTGMRAKGVYYTRQTKTGDIVQGWPRKRIAKYPWYELYKRAEFAYAAYWASNPEPMAYATAVFFAKGTEYLPRDVLLMGSYASLFIITTADGITWTRVRDVAPNPQLILDMVTQDVGAMLYRSPQGWVLIPPGNDGQVLAIFSQEPQWQDVYPVNIGNAEFILGVSDPTLPQGRVLGDSDSIKAALSTPNVATLKRAALTGDVTAPLNDNATTIANGVVTYAKIQDVSATNRLLGRISSGAGPAEELTGAQAATILGGGGSAAGYTPYFNNANIYLIPPTGAGAITGQLQMTANLIYFTPIVVPFNRTFTSAAASLVNGGSIAGSHFKIGVWNRDDTTGGPGTLLLDTGDISSATDGFHGATISLALTPGCYIIGVKCSAQIWLRACGDSSSWASFGYSLGGGSPTPQNQITRSETYSTAFSNEGGNSHTITGGTSMVPIIGLR